jgi:hypothetical protein
VSMTQEEIDAFRAYIETLTEIDTKIEKEI